MINRQQIRKHPNVQSQNMEILPNVHKASLFLSSQNINGSNKSSQNSTDENISVESIMTTDFKKSQSVSSIFNKVAHEKYALTNFENVKPSLKLSVESMVFGQRLQMNCELLLLSTSTELWPLSLHHLNRVKRDFNKFSDCHEELLSSITALRKDIDGFESVIIGRDSINISTDSKIGYINELVTTAIVIMELTYQIVYTISTSQPSWRKSQPGVLDRKTIISAIDDVELSCYRIREVLLRSSTSDDHNSSNQDLKDVMLFSCSQFSSSLTYLAICCRTAAANVDISLKSNQRSKNTPDSRSEENLFKLAMRSVSKSSQCLLASVKNYVLESNQENRFITESFTNSVSSSVKSLAAMATSSKFVGYPSILPPSIKMTRNTICGSCMSFISPMKQLLHTTAAIYSIGIYHPKTFDQIASYSDNTFSHLSQRAITCLAAMRDGLSHLQQTLNLYQSY